MESDPDFARPIRPRARHFRRGTVSQRDGVGGPMLKFLSVAAVTLGAGAPAAGMLPGMLPAQGFGLNDVGTCAVARGYSATGAPCLDGSVIYWNPAAATRLKRFTVYAGATPI